MNLSVLDRILSAKIFSVASVFAFLAMCATFGMLRVVVLHPPSDLQRCVKEFLKAKVVLPLSTARGFFDESGLPLFQFISALAVVFIAVVVVFNEIVYRADYGAASLSPSSAAAATGEEPKLPSDAEEIATTPPADAKHIVESVAADFTKRVMENSASKVSTKSRDVSSSENKTGAVGAASSEKGAAAFVEASPPPAKTCNDNSGRGGGGGVSSTAAAVIDDVVPQDVLPGNEVSSTPATSRRRRLRW